MRAADYCAYAHAVAPEKFLLATEACNCPGVIYEEAPLEWWQRAEHLGMDILQDLLHWCTGWVDWNLILDPTGGPNHLGNRCDANLIADPTKSKGRGSVIVQASYYYMGHFSRYLPPGSRRVEISNTVVRERELTAEDVGNSQPLVFLPCAGTELQLWTLDEFGSLFVSDTKYKCADVSNWGKGPRIDTYECVRSTNQQWARRIDPSCSDEDIATLGVACSQIWAPALNKCLTRVETSGAAVGLDAGTTMVVAQALDCREFGDPDQTFDVVQGDQQGFPRAFPIRSPAIDGGGGADGGGSNRDRELCLQPYIAKEPSFDAVAFETPSGEVSVIALNKGDDPLPFTLYDETLGQGVEGLVAPAHSVLSFRLPAKSGAKPATAKVEVEALDAAGAETARPYDRLALQPSAGEPAAVNLHGVEASTSASSVADRTAPPASAQAGAGVRPLFAAALIAASALAIAHGWRRAAPRRAPAFQQLLGSIGGAPVPAEAAGGSADEEPYRVFSD